MKQIIFALAFIYCVICDGPAYNVPDRAEGLCSIRFTYADYDESLSVSSCVDRDLYNFETYYDKCCYVRFQKNGIMRNGCLGLTREFYMDVPETISILEKGLRKGAAYQYFKDSKIYELNCNSSYLKLFALSFALISLLF